MKAFQWQPPVLPPWRKKVVVFGTRSFDNYQLLADRLDVYTLKFRDVVLVSGAGYEYAPKEFRRAGADYHGERWASKNRYTILRFHPDLEKHGSPTAFHVRNREMAEFVGAGGYGVAFHDGESKGTASMIRLCEKYGIKLKIVRY